MPSALIVRRIKLGIGHVRTEKTRHYHGGALLPTPATLILVQFGPKEYNLIHLDDDGKEMTDTFHETIDDALSQSEREFRVKSCEWEVTEEPYL